MFKKMATKQCLVLLLALTGVGCSGLDTRPSDTIARSKLPVTPRPQVQTQAPRNVYIPRVFEEYKPKQPVDNPKATYEEYAPEKNYRDSYTTPIKREPRAVVEALNPKPIEIKKPVVAEPVKKAVERDNSSKNELDIDPFAAVPDREVLAMTRKDKTPPPTRPTNSMSRAAKALSLAAKAESAIGRHDAAINKVERALRIEPQSPQLWHQLAYLSFKKGRHDQAIEFARKALPMASGNRDLVEENLDLMSKAAVKTGNTKVFKEVLDYKKQNF